MKGEMNGLLPLSEALKQALNLVTKVTETEKIPCADALYRIASADIHSAVNLPPEDNSAMDGYAVRSNEASLGCSLKLCGTLKAGMSPQDCTLSPGGAIRIMTGAPIPPEADAVVMQENTTRTTDTIEILQAPRTGENIRPRGQDISQGERIIAAGSRLSHAHLMILAATGHLEVSVFRKLKVGLVATGDELTSPGEPLNSGSIYESNRAGVAALLRDMNLTIIDYGIVNDDPRAIKSVFSRASHEVDILISSGGVSVGDADYVKGIVADIGTVDFWKIAIKPGKPFAFGRLGRAVFCGLPGNPVSAYVTTEQIVVPIIRKLQGEQYERSYHRLTLPARLESTIKRRPGRQDFQRAHLWRTADGQYHVKSITNQSSGVISSLLNANSYIVVPANASIVEAGTQVEVQPFHLYGNWEI